MSTLVVQYPPEFDGELHVNVERKKDHMQVQFQIAPIWGETEEDTLYRAAKDIVRQIDTNKNRRARGRKVKGAVHG